MNNPGDGCRLWLSPGSCGPRRLDRHITMAVIERNRGRYRIEKITIPPETPSRQRRKNK